MQAFFDRINSNFDTLINRVLMKFSGYLGVIFQGILGCLEIFMEFYLPKLCTCFLGFLLGSSKISRYFRVFSRSNTLKKQQIPCY